MDIEAEEKSSDVDRCSCGDRVGETTLYFVCRISVMRAGIHNQIIIYATNAREGKKSGNQLEQRI